MLGHKLGTWVTSSPKFSKTNLAQDELTKASFEVKSFTLTEIQTNDLRINSNVQLRSNMRQFCQRLILFQSKVCKRLSNYVSDPNTKLVYLQKF